MTDLDPGEYDVCTYCGKSIYPDVSECPYCHKYTDGKGPLSVSTEEPRKLPTIFVLAAWLVVLAILLPVIVYLTKLLSVR